MFSHSQVLECWITHVLLKIINAKRMYYLAESSIRLTKRGSSLDPDQQKPNMSALITFAKVTLKSIQNLKYFLHFESSL